MARKTKKGLSYFPLNVNFFEDDKILFASARFGFKGEIIAIKLLCKIYSENGYYYKWSEDEALLFAKRVGFENALVNDVVSELIKRDFFNKNIFDAFQVLTSKGIQERYFEVTSRRKESAEIKEYLINDNISSLNVCINKLNVDISTQSKVKESKVNKTKVNESKVNEISHEFFKSKNQGSLKDYFESLINGDAINQIAMQLNTSSSDILKRVEDFKKHCELEYASFSKFCFHFKNWVNKEKNNNGKQTNTGSRKADIIALNKLSTNVLQQFELNDDIAGDTK